MLQQQEALLQQQVASLRNEVEELEGSTGSKASQGQSVFRDAPPLRVRDWAGAARQASGPSEGPCRTDWGRRAPSPQPGTGWRQPGAQFGRHFCMACAPS